MGTDARADLVGLDPDAADQLVSAWRMTAAGLRLAAADARGRASVLVLPPPSGHDEHAADALARLAEDLAGRAAQLRQLDAGQRLGPDGGLGVPAPTPTTGWSLPGDDLDRWWAWVLSGGRADLLSPLASDESVWAGLVTAGTAWDGDHARTYVELTPIAGAGIVVVDLFIPFSSSLVLDGDDRDHDDPLFGALEDEDSRVVLALDLERGRGVIQFHESCLVGGWACNAPRPVELDGGPFADDPGPGPDAFGGDIANQVRVRSDGTNLRIDYDVLNSIVPVGSTDGALTLHGTGDGVLVVDRLTADEYPSIGIYQYRAPCETRVLLQRDSGDVWTLFPVVPPSLAGALPERPVELVGAAANPVTGAVVVATATVARLLDTDVHARVAPRPTSCQGDRSGPPAGPG